MTGRALTSGTRPSTAVDEERRFAARRGCGRARAGAGDRQRRPAEALVAAAWPLNDAWYQEALLGEYLAHFDYFLVRPAPASGGGLRGDGFCARGAAGEGRSFEWSLVIILGRITGRNYGSQRNAYEVMKDAGLSKIAAEMRSTTLRDVVGALRDLKAEIDRSASSLANAILDQALTELGIDLDARNPLAGLINRPKNMPLLSDVAAVVSERETLCLWSDDEWKEIALGVLLDGISARLRHAHLASVPPSVEKDIEIGWPANRTEHLSRGAPDVFKFLVALACAAAPEHELIDPRALGAKFTGEVILSYRRATDSEDFDESAGVYPGGGDLRNVSCIAWPLNLLLTPSAPPERDRLEGELTGILTTMAERFASGGPPALILRERQLGRVSLGYEAHDKADAFGEGFLLGTALTWLYHRRRKYPSTSRLPAPPTKDELAGWPKATIPAHVVLAAARGRLTLPVAGVAARLPRGLGPLDPGIDLLAADAPRPPGEAALPYCPPVAPQRVGGRVMKITTPDLLEHRFTERYPVATPEVPVGIPLAALYQPRVQEEVNVDGTDVLTIVNRSFDLQRESSGYVLKVDVVLQNKIERSFDPDKPLENPFHHGCFQADYVVAWVPRVCGHERSVVYTGAGFKEHWRALPPGDYDRAALGDLAGQIAAIRLPPHVRATLFAGDRFDGEAMTLYVDTASLGRLHPASIRIEEGVRLFEDYDFAGASAFLLPGSHGPAALGALTARLSSLTIPRGYRVTLFEGEDFSRPLVALNADIAKLHAFNDRTRSLTIERLV